LLVIGEASAMPSFARTIDLPTMEAMFKAREPLWVAVVNPFLVMMSVFAGGALRTRKRV
jgi:Na+/H+-translocating membrane pyrophosphatase